MSAGFVYPDGVGTRAADELAYAANPEWSEGPSPPLIKSKRGPLTPPGDAANAVYLWLTEQATLRVEAIKSHVLTGRPTPEQMAFKFKVKLSTIVGRGKQKGWIRHVLERVGRRNIHRLEIPQPTRFRPDELHIPEGMIYFGSGAEGSPGELEGLARLAERHGGFGVGIQVAACKDRCRLALDHVAGRKVPLFVDSGAFPEFTCELRGADDCEIGPDEWRRRLEDYRQIARQFKTYANLVAPDKVGSQKKTEQRLKDYGKLLKPSADAGAWILLVGQLPGPGGGAEPLPKFWKRMRAILIKKKVPKKQIAAALPMKHKACTIDVVHDFVTKVKDIGRLHLLGIGPGKADRFLALIRAVRPDLEVTYDSVLIRGGAGRSQEYLSVVPSIYTYAQDIARYEVVSEAFQKSYRGEGSMETWVHERGWDWEAVDDYTDNIGFPSGWLPAQYRHLLAEELRQARGRLFTKDLYALLMDNPDEFLQEQIYPDQRDPKWYTDPTVDAWLDDQWSRFLGSLYSARIKRDGVVMAWRRRDIVAMRQAVPGIESVVSELIEHQLNLF